MRVVVEDDGSSLAEALVAFERRVLDERPDTVTLADASDAALAAALAALKLGVTVEAVPEAREGASDNARLIAQLTPSYTADA